MYERSPIDNECSVFCNTVQIDSGRDGRFHDGWGCRIVFADLRSQWYPGLGGTSRCSCSPISLYGHFSSSMRQLQGRWKKMRNNGDKRGCIWKFSIFSFFLLFGLWQIWQPLVSWCSATSLRRSSWRALVRRSPTSCPTAAPQMEPLPCFSESSTGPRLTLASAATVSRTPRWKR